MPLLSDSSWLIISPTYLGVEMEVHGHVEVHVCVKVEVEVQELI